MTKKDESCSDLIVYYILKCDSAANTLDSSIWSDRQGISSNGSWTDSLDNASDFT